MAVALHRCLPRTLILAGLLGCAATGLEPRGAEGNTAGATADGAGQAAATAGASGARDTLVGGTAGASATDAGSSDAPAPGVAGPRTAPDARLREQAQQCGIIELADAYLPCTEPAMTSFGPCHDDELRSRCADVEFADDDPDHARRPTAFCQSECSVIDGASVWARSCAACARTCDPPGPQSEVHELDTTDCPQRPIIPCGTDAESGQARLDEALKSVAFVPPYSRATFELHDGCVTRFYDFDGPGPLADHAAELTSELAGVRFDCGPDVSCVQLMGSDTLATQ